MLLYSDCVSRRSGDAPGDSVVQTAWVVDVPEAPPPAAPIPPAPLPALPPSPMDPTHAAIANPGPRIFNGASDGRERQTMPH